jgi:hypothetical protein
VLGGIGLSVPLMMSSERDLLTGPMALYVALVQKTMGHSFCLVGVRELNYSVLDKNRAEVDQNQTKI